MKFQDVIKRDLHLRYTIIGDLKRGDRLFTDSDLSVRGLGDFTAAKSNLFVMTHISHKTIPHDQEQYSLPDEAIHEESGLIDIHCAFVILVPFESP